MGLKSRNKGPKLPLVLVKQLKEAESTGDKGGVKRHKRSDLANLSDDDILENYVGELDHDSDENEEDEEIDSDEAFDPEDEHRFADWQFKGSKSEKKESLELSDNKNSKWVDLADALDQNSEKEDSDHLVDKSSDESDNDNNLVLENYVNFMEKQKESLEKDSKRKFLSLDEHLVKESEFKSLPSTKSMNINEMIASLSSNKLVKDSLKNIQQVPNSKFQKLEPSLPPLVVEKLERKAARELTEVEIKNWESIVKANRNAEHLHFPLNKKPMPLVNSNSLVADFKPKLALEEKVYKILASSGMKNESQIEKMENLEFRHLSIDEVRRRRDEIRFARDLMFRHEIKAKRAAKIKSKKYRKLLRKDKLKIKAIQDEDVVDEERERAIARMTLRHKNNAFNLRKGELSRSDLEKNIEEEEELQRMIQGTEEEKNISEEIENESIEFPKSGLLSMKFMQKAIERKNRVNDGEEITQQRGRKTFNSNNKIVSKEKPIKEIFPVEIAKTSENIYTLARNLKKNRQADSDPRKVKELTDEENPWLIEDDIATISNHTDAQDLPKDKKLLLEKAELNDSSSLNLTSEDDDNEAIQLLRKDQKDLVREAFASDDVFQDFSQKREKLATEDAPKIVDDTLPGWGSWVGEGIKKAENKVLRKIPGVEVSNRKDATNKKLIINEKRIKKADNLYVEKIPFPYETQQHYEIAMRHPLGTEWNTRRIYNKAITPRILVKRGEIIEPIKKV